MSINDSSNTASNFQLKITILASNVAQTKFKITENHFRIIAIT